MSELATLQIFQGDAAFLLGHMIEIWIYLLKFILLIVVLKRLPLPEKAASVMWKLGWFLLWCHLFYTLSDVRRASVDWDAMSEYVLILFILQWLHLRRTPSKTMKIHQFVLNSIFLYAVAIILFADCRISEYKAFGHFAVYDFLYKISVPALIAVEKLHAPQAAEAIVALIDDSARWLLGNLLPLSAILCLLSARLLDGIFVPKGGESAPVQVESKPPAAREALKLLLFTALVIGSGLLLTLVFSDIKSLSANSLQATTDWKHLAFLAILIAAGYATKKSPSLRQAASLMALYALIAGAIYGLFFSRQMLHLELLSLFYGIGFLFSLRFFHSLAPVRLRLWMAGMLLLLCSLSHIFLALAAAIGVLVESMGLGRFGRPRTPALSRTGILPILLAILLPVTLWGVSIIATWSWGLPPDVHQRAASLKGPFLLVEENTEVSDPVSIRRRAEETCTSRGLEVASLVDMAHDCADTREDDAQWIMISRENLPGGLPILSGGLINWGWRQKQSLGLCPRRYVWPASIPLREIDQDRVVVFCAADR